MRGVVDRDGSAGVDGSEGVGGNGVCCPDRGNVVERTVGRLLDVVFEVGANPHQVEACDGDPVKQCPADSPERTCRGSQCIILS